MLSEMMTDVKCSICLGDGGLTPLFEDDPVLVTENFGLGIGFDPPNNKTKTQMTWVGYFSFPF